METPSPHLKHIRRRKCARVEGLAWLSFVLLSLFFGIYMTSKAMAEEMPEVEAGQLLFKDDQGNYSSAIHLKSDVSISINGMIAKVELTQRFENQSSGWQEGVYVFPLPENAAVNYMEMQIGDRIIIGEIKEKNIAKKIYQQAKAEGKKASLVEQQRPNLFTQKVANIAPSEAVAVKIHYLQRVEYNQGLFSLRFPTTLTARYIPGQSTTENLQEQQESTFSFNPLGWATPTNEVPDADLITPFMTTNKGDDGNTLSLVVNLNAGLPLANIDALYHDVRISKDIQYHHIEFQNSIEKMDRDFVLQWAPTLGGEPQAAVFKETIENEDYLMLMLLPPQQGLQDKNQFLARDMIFIIDTSGSMQGTSIIQARESLALALTRLRPEDNFNIIEFNSNYTSLYHQPQRADSHNIKNAINWVSRLKANGGTEMSGALRAALTQMEQTGRLQQIVFITDGAVGNESALFQLIHQYLGDTRLFTVGIGSAPNSYFMRKAAEFGRGSFTHIGSTREVKSSMEALFLKLESAVVSHITIQWPFNVEAYPQKLPDLYIGEPLLLSAKTSAVHGVVQIDGFTANNTWSKTLQLDIENQSAGVASIWARAKVESLEDQKHRGKDADEVREQVLDVALSHKLVTAYTSFVAVEKEISRAQTDSLNTSAVPNLVAKGQVPQVQTLSYPQGATSAELSFILGFISIVIWLVFCVCQRLAGE